MPFTTRVQFHSLPYSFLCWKLPFQNSPRVVYTTEADFNYASRFNSRSVEQTRISPPLCHYRQMIYKCGRFYKHHLGRLYLVRAQSSLCIFTQKYLCKCEDTYFILQHNYLCINEDSFGAKIHRDE